MATPTDSFVPSTVYNTLPLISQVASAPEDRSDDLRDLRELLQKHNVPRGVSVRLIHKHFDTAEGEVMIFDKISVPGHGFAKIMKPIIPGKEHRLRGLHYLVNDSGSLQAYEYGVGEDVPDMSGFDAFVAEFCKVVSERGLQRVFGLKLQGREELENVGWTEYELHSKRGTIMFPDGMPMPDGDSDYSVVTEWTGILTQHPRNCKHSTVCSHGPKTCRHCSHCSRHATDLDSCHGDGSGFCLGGQDIRPGTAVHDVVERIITAF